MKAAVPPIRQAERFDPDGVYVRRYIPELKFVEGKATHRPWRLDRPGLSEAAGVVP